MILSRPAMPPQPSSFLSERPLISVFWAPPLQFLLLKALLPASSDVQTRDQILAIEYAAIQVVPLQLNPQFANPSLWLVREMENWTGGPVHCGPAGVKDPPKAAIRTNRLPPP
jgi:hypothetical protein